jgi:hypothetical protein
MTETAPQATTESPVRAVYAGLLGFAGHALAILGGYIAGRVVRPSTEGFEDLAAVIVTFFGVEILLGLACLIGGAIVFRRGHRHAGLGLIGGWLVGLSTLVLLTRLQIV